MKVLLTKLQSLEVSQEVLNPRSEESALVTSEELLGFELSERKRGFLARRENLVPLIVPEQEDDSNIHGDERNLENRKALIKSTAPEPHDFAYERAIGNNDSVYSNFVELIVEAKKKVGRIAVIEENTFTGYATGFMVSDSLLLTNWHVLSHSDEAKNSTVEFNYEYDTRGNLKDSITFGLNPNKFFYSNKGLDFCLVAVNERDLSDTYHLSEFGHLFLSNVSGKLGDTGKEALNIIHHPDGDPKQLSIRENTFVKVLSNAIWYESDTAQGSSGSPVFNDQFQVVALHHMGVASKDDNGNYLDKKGDPIPIDANNKIDISKIHWIANEGIRISVIRKDLEAKFPTHPLVNEVLQGSYTQPVRKEQKTASRSVTENGTLGPLSSDFIHVAIPSQTLSIEKSLTINISSGIQSSDTENGQRSYSNLIEQESLRLERTINLDDCRGYQSSFLGRGDLSIGIPKPKNRARIARLDGSNAYILKYHKYSVIFNSHHKMPFISAINVDGDEDKRKDITERKDKWIRDRRINLSIQLDNDFYYKSGFDRGHMSRREDANWGSTAEEAKRNADMTCFHTNACPQVPTLNRSNKSGLWGKLEKIVLEKGAIKEDGQTGKISVFSGPVFDQDDPTFRGVQIPMSFYKVILWLDDNRNLKATAFMLSQEELVSSIEFEAIDIDQDVTFKEFQVSLEHLENLTQIDFSEIVEFDTYDEDELQHEIINEEGVVRAMT